jgi:hypothetical protein
LSSGISNAYGTLDPTSGPKNTSSKKPAVMEKERSTIAEQIKLLEANGATVSLLGVGPHPVYRNNNVNEELKSLANSNNIKFLNFREDDFNSRVDLIHPSTYGKLVESSKTSTESMLNPKIDPKSITSISSYDYEGTAIAEDQLLGQSLNSTLDSPVKSDKSAPRAAIESPFNYKNPQFASLSPITLISFT